MSTIILQPRSRKVGGWLVLLILSLAFGTPGAAKRNIEEMNEMFTPYIDRVPSLRAALQIYTYLQWGVALLSLYCAYLLAFRKPGAVTVAKRGLIVIVVLQVAASFCIPLLGVPRGAAMGPQLLTELAKLAISALVWPLVFFGIWYTYLVRSERVRDTYADS